MTLGMEHFCPLFFPLAYTLREHYIENVVIRDVTVWKGREYERERPRSWGMVQSVSYKKMLNSQWLVGRSCQISIYLFRL